MYFQQNGPFRAMRYEYIRLSTKELYCMCDAVCILQEPESSRISGHARAGDSVNLFSARCRGKLVGAEEGADSGWRDAWM